MATSYYRIELNYCLDMDEVAKKMIEVSEGCVIKACRQVKMPGHYSAHDWMFLVKKPGTASGPGSQVLIGITDYENFVRKYRHNGRHNGRRRDHRHFWARGRHSAVLQVVDFFKAAIPKTLWRDVLIPEDERRMWAKVEADTIIPKITVAKARTAAEQLAAERP